jgi:hypothetical protein
MNSQIQVILEVQRHICLKVILQTSVTSMLRCFIGLPPRGPGNAVSYSIADHQTPRIVTDD